MKCIGIFLGVTPNAGGMFQYAISLLDALEIAQSRGWKVKVGYIGDEWSKELAVYSFEKESISFGKIGLKLSSLLMVLPLPTSLVRGLTSLFNPVYRALSKISCDIWVFPAQDALAYQLKLNAIATIHDLMHIYESHFPEVSSGGRTRIRNRRFRNISKWSKGILVDSNVGKEHVKEVYHTDENIIYPLPYIPSPTIKANIPEESFLQKYNLPKKFIFYPAQFWEHKNHLRLLKAAAIVREHHPDLTLVFTGMKIRCYDQIRDFIEKNNFQDNVHFAGYVPNEDLSGFYSKARAMMMPTFFGPTNIPPLEAFICMPEQLGDGALYFDPLNVDEMAQVMMTLWENDGVCESLSDKGHKKNKEWSLEQFSKRFIDIIENVYAKL